jgi:arsenate reductase-like glutaredoxin family protein
MFADDKVRIKLKNANIDAKFIDLFKNKTKIKSIKQSFNLVNNMAEVVQKIEYEYNNLKISNIEIISCQDNVAEMNVRIYNETEIL